MGAGVAQGDSEQNTMKGHPQLRDDGVPCSHKFSHGQMEVLAAICNTFVPSLPLEASGLDPNGDNSEEILAKCSMDGISAFYRLDAVTADVPDKVARLFAQRMKDFPLLLIGAGLWLLSTYLGTFAMCGLLCLSSRFPFVHRFPDMSLAKREMVLLKWAHSRIPSLQKIFKLCKGYTLFCFYSKVGSDGCNPCWNAIGYTGPAAELPQGDEPGPRPLEGKVVDAEAVGAEGLRSVLGAGGFSPLDEAALARLRALAAQDEAGKTIVGVRCDAVVVGSGSGGGVAAGVLASGGQKVLVLEQGQYFARDDLSLLEYPSMANMYEGGGVLATDCGAVNLLAGATVGGGSAVNWAAAFRTPDHVRREWAQGLGLPLFASDDYDRAMDAVCAKGAVHCSCELESFQNAALRRGCQRLGVDVATIPRNVRGQHACGFCNFGCSKGEKLATSETWLVEATARGALILSNCRARAVLHRATSTSTSAKDREAVGVVAAVGDILLFIEARATVVACGSLNTPPLLLRSGFRNRNIGRHFHCHPVIMGWGYFPEGTGPRGTVYDGPIMTAVSKHLANWDSDSRAYGSLLEVPILHPGSFAGIVPWTSGSAHKERMRKYARTAHFIVLCRDQGAGRVMLDRNGQSTKILYRVQPVDAPNMLQALELGLRSLVAAGAVEIGTHHVDGHTLDVLSSSREQLDDFIRREMALASQSLAQKDLSYPVSSAHQMSTCRMGADPESSVVDAGGEAWEAARLFIADASVFPTASGVNPMLTVQSIAYCTAHSALQKLR
ncbi:long-chain-alcohol oxidase [Marchantia polymorpha subsp. ruderalis]